MPACTQLAQLSAVGENTRPWSPCQLVHYGISSTPCKHRQSFFFSPRATRCARRQSRPRSMRSPANNRTQNMPPAHSARMRRSMMSCPSFAYIILLLARLSPVVTAAPTARTTLPVDAAEAARARLQWEKEHAGALPWEMAGPDELWECVEWGYETLGWAAARPFCSVIADDPHWVRSLASCGSWHAAHMSSTQAYSLPSRMRACSALPTHSLRPALWRRVSVAWRGLPQSSHGVGRATGHAPAAHTLIACLKRALSLKYPTHLG